MGITTAQYVIYQNHIKNISNEVIKIKGRFKIITIIFVVLFAASAGLNVYLIVDRCNQSGISKTEPEKVSTISVETPYCSLNYPSQYKDKLTTKVKSDSDDKYVIEFYGNDADKSVHIYDIEFDNSSKNKIGSIKTKDGDVIGFGYTMTDFTSDNKLSQKEIDSFAELQETVNFIVNDLTENGELATSAAQK